MKALAVIGTRPEAIKLAPVIRELRSRTGAMARTTAGAWQTRVCVTGQHREMLDQVLADFNIEPDIDLDLMQKRQSPTQVAARVLASLEPQLEAERPDWVLVQGDTTTVMAAAIASFHLRLRIAHVEAGLRTADRFNPFPEEMNRVLTDHLSDLHFAPTQAARSNLLREGIAEDRIHVTGNTVVDALRWIADQPVPPEAKRLLERLDSHRARSAESTNGPRLILVTAHRRESFGAPLRRICHALRDLAARRADVHIVYPVHLSPNVRETVQAILGEAERVTLLSPLGYRTLIHLMKHCCLVLTDSGGIQEEAPSLGVPVLVLRDTTERPEAVEAGASRIVGTDSARILAACEQLLDNPEDLASMARAGDVFGDGRAAARIVDALEAASSSR